MSTHFEKPANMRGMLVAQTKRTLIIGLLVAAGAGMVQKWRGMRRKAIYKEFYDNYDIYAVFDEMLAKGVFQTAVIEPDDDDKKDKKDKKKK